MADLSGSASSLVLSGAWLASTEFGFICDWWNVCNPAWLFGTSDGYQFCMVWTDIDELRVDTGARGESADCALLL